MQTKEAATVWCRFQHVLGPGLGFPPSFLLWTRLLVCLKAGTSDLPRGFLAFQGVNGQLAYPFPFSSFSHGFNAPT